MFMQFRPPPIVIGAVSDGGAVVIVDVSLLVTTDVSVVGNAPGELAGDAPAEVAGAVELVTTEVSSVGNCGAAPAAGDEAGETAAPAIGEGSALAGAFS